MNVLQSRHLEKAAPCGRQTLRAFGTIMLYYLVTSMVFAAALAATTVVSEVSAEYIANYMANTEGQDYGINPPAKDSGAKPGSAPETRAATVLPQAANRPAATSSPILPVLMSRTEGSSRFADERATGGSYRVASLSDSVPAASPEPAAAGATSAVAAVDPGQAVKDEKVAQAEQAPPVIAPQQQPRAALDLLRDTPHRRPDGTAFLPMSTQRVFSLRWQTGRAGDVAMAYEIPGHVITDPSAGTTVNAPLPGIIEANAGSFPFLGMRVKRGDLLAYLQPTVAVSERAQIEARIQQLSNQISLAEKQMERLGDVLFVRYRTNKIEAMKVQIDGYRRELVSLQNALGRREALRATGDGVISNVAAVVGGTVAQGQVVFEIVDADTLWVEAAAYDPAIVQNIRSATATSRTGRSLKLDFIGGGMTLSNQAVPLRFRVVGAHEGVTVGTPVTVIVQQNLTISGIQVPSSSVIRDADGRSIVWERTGAETFMPRQVRATRIAGNQMVVESGLSDGARVVTEGASLLNQIR